MPAESSGPPWATPPERPGPMAQVTELKTLVVGYAKQETVDPLKSLGRSLGLGIAGSVLLALGLFLLLLALLRGLQQIEFFNEPGVVGGGTWSWLPYLITAVIGLLVMGGFVWSLATFSSRSAARTDHGGPR